MIRMIRHGRSAALAAALAAVFLAAPAALAADVTDIGFVDQAALSALPSFQSASKQLSGFSDGLRRQYAGRAKGASQSQQAALMQEYQGKMADRQRQLFGPLFSKAQVAIASIASSKNLTVVVDKRIVIFGGTDITQNVRDLLSSPGDPVPPVSSPPPSSVGYVDQAAIDGVPKIKAVQEDFVKFKNDQDKAAQDKLKNAKSAADRDTIFKDYKKTLDDKSNQTIKPLVDQTRTAIS